MSIKSIICNLIKRATHSANLSDGGNYAVQQSTYMGKKTENYEMIFPYGFSANPTLNSLVLLFNVNGQEQNLAGIVNDPPNRFKDLKPGEVQVGSFDKKTSIKFNSDGDVIINSPSNDVIIEAAKNVTVSAQSDVTINAANDININSGADITVNSGNEVTINADSSVNIDSQGDVSIDASGTATIDATLFTINSDAVINGSLTVNGEIIDITGKKVSDIITNYNAHFHTDIGGDPTSGPSNPV